MSVIFKIQGFTQYQFIDKVLYRMPYKTPSKRSKWQYRSKRVINITLNNGIKGYILVKNNKRKWYSLTRLKHLLIKQI